MGNFCPRSQPTPVFVPPTRDLYEVERVDVGKWEIGTVFRHYANHLHVRVVDKTGTTISFAYNGVRVEMPIATLNDIYNDAPLADFEWRSGDPLDLSEELAKP